MRVTEDPRIKEGRRSLALAWGYFFVYLAVIMILSYNLGIKPYVWGLPRWVAIGNVVVPVVFVIVLIFVVEKFIPNISLTDDEQTSDEEE